MLRLKKEISGAGGQKIEIEQHQIFFKLLIFNLRQYQIALSCQQILCFKTENTVPLRKFLKLEIRHQKSEFPTNKNTINEQPNQPIN